MLSGAMDRRSYMATRIYREFLSVSKEWTNCSGINERCPAEPDIASAAAREQKMGDQSPALLLRTSRV